MSPDSPLYKETRGERSADPVDRLIGAFDQALRTVTGIHECHRPYPAEQIEESLARPEDRRHVAALMRVNHAGEVAAQALYAGQGITAHGGGVQESMRRAAQEESEHLDWCARRIRELGGRTSLLNPLWYAGSFVIGAVAGIAGDRTSLGFVAETEKQVVEHLSEHLRRLPSDDARTRAIVETMRDDEGRHGANAEKAGGSALALPVRAAMKLISKVMTRTAYWI